MFLHVDFSRLQSGMGFGVDFGVDSGSSHV